MTTYDDNWMAEEQARRTWLAENGMYREEDEHASCGVGLVVSIDGQPSRKVVENGIEALKAVWHRGAVDADGKTGDGAGIHGQTPQAFFRNRSAAPATNRATTSRSPLARSFCRAPISAPRKLAARSSKPKC